MTATRNPAVSYGFNDTQFDKSRGDGFDLFTTEASVLGLSPGEWPPSFVMHLSDGSTRRFEHFHEDDMEVTYRTSNGAYALILND